MNEELLDLLMACILYIEAKQSKPNPFVKKLGINTSDEEEAFKFLVHSTQEAMPYLPLVAELNERRMKEIDAIEQGSETE